MGRIQADTFALHHTGTKPCRYAVQYKHQRFVKNRDFKLPGVCSRKSARADIRGAAKSFLCRPEHGQETGDVRRVGRDRVFEGAGHGAQSGLVKYAVRARANLPACFQVADVTFDEREIFPLVRIDRLLDFVQVAPVAGGEIVEAYDLLVRRQELFQEVGAYEAGDSGDEPGFGGRLRGWRERVRRASWIFIRVS